MQVRRIEQADGFVTFVVILETGDEVMACLKRFAVENGLDSASFKAIGAFERAVLAYFDWERKEYLPIPVKEQVEVASLLGDVAVSPEGKPALHVHLVLGRRDGTALAGHLAEARVRPTLELIVTEAPAHLRRRKDPETGLSLIELGERAET